MDQDTNLGRITFEAATINPDSLDFPQSGQLGSNHLFSPSFVELLQDTRGNLTRVELVVSYLLMYSVCDTAPLSSCENA